MDLHRCLRGHWRIEGNFLRVVEPAGPVYHTIIPTPSWLARFYDRILAVAKLSCRPRLLVLEEAGRHGGFHTPGLVAVGRRDVADLAEQINRQNFRDATEYEVWLARMRNQQVFNRDELLAEIRVGVYHLILTHEIGHAVDVDRGRLRYGIPAERFADGIAGEIAEWLETRSVWEREALRLMGCEVGACQHASPSVRVADYDAGRAAVREKQAEREHARQQRLLNQTLYGQRRPRNMFEALFG